MAAPKLPPAPGPAIADLSAQLFAHFDTNKNGLISLGELDAVAKDLHLSKDKFKADFAKLDTNGDGSLSVAEVNAGLAKLDADHNGHISVAEAQYVLVPLLGSAVSLLNQLHH